jgi:CrcB protein
LRRAVAIAVGGVIGAALRWGVLTAWGKDKFPWPVLVVNVVGSVLLGVLVAEEWRHPHARLLLHDLGGIGVCGGLTTFSTFSLDVVQLARHGDAGLAAVYAVASVTLAILGVVAGAAALRGVRALVLPLEESP